MNNNKLKDVIKYYSLATPKEKLDINKILTKAKDEELSEAENNRLNKYAFKSRMYFYSNSANVDSRRNKIIRGSVTCTGNNNKND